MALLIVVEYESVPDLSSCIFHEIRRQDLILFYTSGFK